MNNEKLIELITEEVMKRLKALIKTEENNKKILILEKKENLCPIVSKFLQENKISIHSLDDMESLENYEAILLQNISNVELVNLSMAQQSSLKEKVAIEALLKGEKVYALEKGLEYTKYKDTANKQLLKVFENHKDQLASYGINFVGLKTLLAGINEESKVKDTFNKTTLTEISDEESEKEDKAFCCNKVLEKTELLTKKLVTEVDLRNLLKDGVKNIAISKKSIVTPLARDFARVSKMKINIEN